MATKCIRLRSAVPRITRCRRRSDRGAARHRQKDDRTRAGHGRSARCRLHVERAAVPVAGCLGAVAARQPGSPHGRRHAEAEDGSDRRPVQRARPQRTAEPGTALRVPSPAIDCRKRRTCAERSSPTSRAAPTGVPSPPPTSRRRWRSTSRPGRTASSFDDGHSRRRRARSFEPVLLVSNRERSGGRSGPASRIR